MVVCCIADWQSAYPPATRQFGWHLDAPTPPGDLPPRRTSSESSPGLRKCSNADSASLLRAHPFWSSPKGPKSRHHTSLGQRPRIQPTQVPIPKFHGLKARPKLTLPFKMGKLRHHNRTCESDGLVAQTGSLLYRRLAIGRACETPQRVLVTRRPCKNKTLM
jgi:hypothetical protein